LFSREKKNVLAECLSPAAIGEFATRKSNGFSWSLGDLCWCRFASVQLGADN
jgi:hypothetical protein